MRPNKEIEPRSDSIGTEQALAAEKSDDAATKSFASEMVAEHTKTSAELKAAVASDPKTPIPAALDSSHQNKLDKLKGLSGADFRKQYRAMQIDAHEDAVSLFQRYAKGGDSETLKRSASQTLPALQHHLDMEGARQISCLWPRRQQSPGESSGLFWLSAG